MVRNRVRFLHVGTTTLSSPDTELNLLDNYKATIYKFKLVKNE